MNRLALQFCPRYDTIAPDSILQDPGTGTVSADHSPLLFHISLSMMSLIICIGMSPSVRIASLFGSGLIKNTVGNPRT